MSNNPQSSQPTGQAVPLQAPDFRPQGSTPQWGQPIPGQATQQVNGSWGYQPKARKPSKKPLFIIGGVVLVLIIAAIASILVVTSAKKSKAQAAADAVKEYLTAVSEGRANDATSKLNLSGADTSLLTDEVLNRSKQLAPITDIVTTVPELENEYTVDVPVSYKIGGTMVSTELSVDISEGAKIASSLGEINLKAVSALQPTLNGATPATEEPLLFPGTYEVALNSPYLQTAQPTLTVEDSTTYLGESDLDLRPTEEAVKTFRDKVKGDIEACVASKAIDPGCGAALPSNLDNGEALIDGSIIRKLSAEAHAKLDALAPTPDLSNPTILSVLSSELGTMELEANIQTSSGVQHGTLVGNGRGFDFGRPVLNLLDPELKVTWK